MQELWLLEYYGVSTPDIATGTHCPPGHPWMSCVGRSATAAGLAGSNKWYPPNSPMTAWQVRTFSVHAAAAT